MSVNQPVAKALQMRFQSKSCFDFLILPLVLIVLSVVPGCTIYIGENPISLNKPKIRMSRSQKFNAEGYWGRKGKQLPLKTALVQYTQGSQNTRGSRKLEVYLYDFELTAEDRSQIAKTQYIDEIHLQKPSHDPEKDLHFRVMLRIEFDPNAEQLTEEAIQRVSVFSTGFLDNRSWGHSHQPTIKNLVVQDTKEGSMVKFTAENISKQYELVATVESPIIKVFTQ